MTAIYTANPGNGDTLSIKADFGQASSPILLSADSGKTWDSTPFQVADAGHNSTTALKMVNAWQESQGGGCWAPGKTTGIKVVTRRA